MIKPSSIEIPQKITLKLLSYLDDNKKEEICCELITKNTDLNNKRYNKLISVDNNVVVYKQIEYTGGQYKKKEVNSNQFNDFICIHQFPQGKSYESNSGDSFKNRSDSKKYLDYTSINKLVTKALLLDEIKNKDGGKMNDAYLMLDGVRIDLTDDQIKKLNVNINAYCFDRKVDNNYFYISSTGVVFEKCGTEDAICNLHYETANYCSNRSILEQRALHEILDRLLWRFSMQNMVHDLDWKDSTTQKWFIYFNSLQNCFEVNSLVNSKTNCVFFETPEIAHRAIDEVIIPFIKAHPNFKW